MVCIVSFYLFLVPGIEQGLMYAKQSYTPAPSFSLLLSPGPQHGREGLAVTQTHVKVLGRSS